MNYHNIKLKRTVIAFSISMMVSGTYAQQADDTTQGKRLDNARVDMHTVPAPAEIEPAVSYPLPSGVSRSDVAIMKAMQNKLPERPATVRKSFGENLSGALFVSGKAYLTDFSRAELDQLIARFKNKQNLKIAVSGHTDNQRLSPATKKLFKDNQGLSEARALTVATYLRDGMGLKTEQLAIEGLGESRPLESNDTPEGMAKNRRVELRIWFDEVAYTAPAAPIPQVARAACAQEAAAASDLPFRITIDGEPVNINDKALEADRQRCVDVALEKGDIQVRYDSLATAPAMNVWATPNGVVQGEAAEFRAWSNYIPWVKKSELRLFRPGQKTQETPLAVLPMSWTTSTKWTPPANAGEQLFYLLRVYDEQGRFDETGLKPLTILAHARPLNDNDKIERERLTGYGENSLNLRNIPVTGGTVTVNGTHLKTGQRVEALGLELPVDPNGKFAIKQIMPNGPHTVEVKVTEADGRFTTFRRNLTIAKDDWFYVALGDLTVGRNQVAGPASLVTTDTQHYDDRVYVDGRGAFYLKGKIKGDYLLTASADTREQPIDQLFSNFSSKDPRYLLRNINPDLYYPVYGDDSTTVDDAPTQGKFFVKLEKGDSHIMWGNFQASWSG
ncbi:MAG: OmpA family protein, partial [Burkholderiaceae bacterium]